MLHSLLDIVPTLEESRDDNDSPLLLEDSFFGVMKDGEQPLVAVNPPRAVFAESGGTYNLFGEGESQQQPTSESDFTPFTATSFYDTSSVPSFAYSTLTDYGWQERNQDLWFLENLEGPAVTKPHTQSSSAPVTVSSSTTAVSGERVRSQEDILEEIRLEANELQGASRDGVGSPTDTLASSISDTASDFGGTSTPASSHGDEVEESFSSQQETIYIDGEPVLSIPADQLPQEFLRAAGPEVFLQLTTTTSASGSNPVSVKVKPVASKNVLVAEAGERWSQTEVGGKKKTRKVGRWRTSAIADPKERKKAQNREAAARYRIKKQMEKDGQMSELTEQESRNAQLRQKVSDLEHEIRYLKNLMQEIQSKSH